MGSKHPLDPLGGAELEAAATLLREAGLLENATRIVLLELHEPIKDELDEFDSGADVERRASAIVRTPRCWGRPKTACRQSS